MWSSGRRVLQELLSQPAVRSFSLSPAQNTVVVERWWQVPLSKVGSPPRLHPRRHRIYKLVEDTSHTPQGKMQLILTQTVPKLGGRGDTVVVKKSVGRNKLLSQGLAVYPSPENKQIFAEELRLLREGKIEDRIQTRTGQFTVELLKRSKLKIIKMPSDEFQLNKEVICRQFQKKLRIVVPPHALSLPFESVKDVGEYWCEVKVNGIDAVRVPISLLPYENPSASYQRQLKAQMLEQQAAADLSEPAAAVEAVSEAAVEAVSEAAAVEAVSEAAVEAISEAAVEAVSEAAAVEAVSEAAVEAVSEAAVVEAVSEAAAVEAVSEAAAVEAVSEAAAVEAVSEAAAVEAVSEAAAVEAVSEAAAVEAVSEAAAVEAVSEAAAVEAVSEAAAVEAEAGKDSVSQVSEASASAGVSDAKKETAASTQTGEDTTAPPSDSPKKD